MTSQPESKRTKKTELKQATAPSSSFDWDKIDFSEKQVNGHISVQWHQDRGWGKPQWNTSPFVNLHVAATGLNYGQQAFEGIKAFRTSQNTVHIFRPKENAKRINLSARVASMPEIPEDLFLDCLKKAVAGNLEWVPPYAPQSSKGSLYIRPLLVGTGPKLMLGSPDEFTFFIWVTHVGSLYGSGDDLPAIDAFVLDTFDRSAPMGTGYTKLGGNYAPVFLQTTKAKKAGYPITLHLDSAEHKYIDEFSTSNAIGIKVEGGGAGGGGGESSATSNGNGIKSNVTLVVPESVSILRSVTKLCIVDLAEKVLGWNVEIRKVTFDEVKAGAFQEFMAAGTAAVITPVKSISYNTHAPILMNTESSITDPNGPVFDHPKENKVVKIEISKGVGEYTKLLFDELTSYQCGDRCDQFDWLWPSEGIDASDAL